MARVEVKLEGGHAQVIDRYTGFMNDQHGRTWTGIFSKRSGDPSDVPTPTRWTAPQSPSYLRGFFIPPPQYRKMHRPEAQPFSLLVDYDGWISDLNSAQSHHDQTKVDVINHQAAGFDAINLMENPPPSLLRIIGPGPFPPLEIVERMGEGDLWALGQTDVVPAWFTTDLEQQIVHTARATGLFQTWQLRELSKLERAGRKQSIAKETTETTETTADITTSTTWPVFLSASRKAGKSPAEAAEDWKLHKDAVMTAGA